MGQPLITGIDIGHHSIKAAVLKPNGKHFQIKSLHELPMPQDLLNENQTFDLKSMTKLLKRLRKKLPAFSKNLAISVPDSAVMNKVIQLEKSLDESEREFAIHQAFSMQSPIPIDELNLDFIEVTAGPANKTNTVAFQVFATKKELVDGRCQTAEKAGFKPLVVDAQVHGLLRVSEIAQSKFSNRKNWLLVDIGSTQTSLCIVNKGDNEFVKDIPLGTQFIESEGSQSQDKVTGINTLKTDTLGGDDSINSLEQRTDAFIKELATRLQRHIQLYNSVNADAGIDGIWLTGGGASTRALPEELSRRLSVKCEVLNPSSLFEMKIKKRAMHMDMNVFAVAVGLAMSGATWIGGDHAL